MGSRFNELVAQIPQIGRNHHAETILENSRRNAPFIEKTIRDAGRDSRPCLVVSAGPSLYFSRSLYRLRGFTGQVVATDSAYIQCLKAGIEPDYVVTIDPHPTRIAVLFGATSQDDYFERARADHGFEQAEENQRLVDENRTKLVIACSAPESVVERTKDFERYWFAPLVDDPDAEGLTKQMVELTQIPALNTGGTVGSAAWAFAHLVLKAEKIAVVGMDFGYQLGTPLKNTQEWNLLKGEQNISEFYPVLKGHWGDAYTSPTYYWYRQNFLDLLKAADARVTNCTEGGLLHGESVDCMGLEEWLASC